MLPIQQALFHGRGSLPNGLQSSYRKATGLEYLKQAKLPWTVKAGAWQTKIHASLNLLVSFHWCHKRIIKVVYGNIEESCKVVEYRSGNLIWHLSGIYLVAFYENHHSWARRAALIARDLYAVSL